MRTLLAFLLLIGNTIYSQVRFEDYFIPKTLRIDYYHSGNHINEYYVLDRAMEEPYWSGSKDNLFDVFDYGHHRVFVTDSATGTLIFSKGYSSLFAEWRVGEEAKNQCGNFTETVLVPFPKKTVQLEFFTRNKSNIWVSIASFYVNPQTSIVENQDLVFFENVKIHDSGMPEENLDIVFLAEGYTSEQMDKFLSDCNKLATSLLSIEPFQKNKNKINIWAVKSVSTESGVSNPVNEVFKETVLGASFNTFNTERYLMSLDHFAIRDAASNVPYDHIYVIVNSDEYGGGGIYNFYSIGTSSNAFSDFLLFHEFGHTLGGLADEYVSDDEAFQELYNSNFEPWEPNITTLNAFERKWKKSVKKNTPVPTPENINGNIIGVYEGAGYTTHGVYRPMKDCIMRSANQRKYCKICENALTKTILFYAE
ncbi:MAG: M64 family metallopeptidase [Bacteroidales bacterium]|nr:M64 family metallopeptidase [Bacteroidales bacterium]